MQATLTAYSENPASADTSNLAAIAAALAQLQTLIGQMGR
jgi:hypothetical protein